MEFEIFKKKLDNSLGCPVIIHDFYVQAWRVYRFYEQVKVYYRRESNINTAIKCAWAVILNGLPVSNKFYSYRSICIGDHRTEELGGYWRHKMIEEDPKIKELWRVHNPRKKELSYKGGRGDKPEGFVNTVLPIGIEYAKKYLSYFSFPGYEADDIGGYIYRNCRENPNRIKVFHTIDRDWLQLVDDTQGFYWVTNRVPKMNERFQNQVADNKEVIRFSELKHNYPIDHPSEFIESKVVTGDSGDNLPPGCPREYMDLVKPHPIFNIGAVAKDSGLKDEISNYEPNTNKEHFYRSIETLRKMRLKLELTVI